MAIFWTNFKTNSNRRHSLQAVTWRRTKALQRQLIFRKNLSPQTRRKRRQRDRKRRAVGQENPTRRTWTRRWQRPREPRVTRRNRIVVSRQREPSQRFCLFGRGQPESGKVEIREKESEPPSKHVLWKGGWEGEETHGTVIGTRGDASGGSGFQRQFSRGGRKF